MADSISIEIKGLEEVSKTLQKAFKKLDDPSPLLDQIGQRIVANTKLRFERQEDPDGNKWEALLPSTLRARRKKGAGAKILQDTRALFRSITYVVGKNSTLVGTNLEYAGYHQLGTKHIPARPYLGLDKRDKDDIIFLANRYLSQALARS